MKIVKPDFYDRFACIADRCRHSCCIGWEIDVDEESLAYYQRIPGEMGQLLQKQICPGEQPHFCLGEGDRCPFLEKDGLCKLIKELGEESLCDICREHPRFYNCFEEREEWGLGLCCEEVVRLLLEGEEPLRFLEEGEEAYTEEVFHKRQELLEILSCRDEPLPRRFQRAMAALGEELPELSLSHWADLFLGLERMDERWTGMLLLLKERGEGLDLTPALSENRYERLCCYLLYRHFASWDDAPGILGFCILACRMIAALDLLEGPDGEHIRLFSSEIEYSDENIPLILEEMSRKQEERLATGAVDMVKYHG